MFPSISQRLLCMIGLFLMASPVMAEPERPVLMPYAPGYSEPVGVNAEGAEGEVHRALSLGPASQPALSGFVFRTQTGASGWSHLAVTADSSVARLSLRQGDQTFRFTAQAHWWAGTFERRVIRLKGRSRASGAIDVPAGYVAVLQGFDIRSPRAAGPLRAFSLTLADDGRHVELVLRNGQPWEAEISYVLVPSERLRRKATVDGTPAGSLTVPAQQIGSVEASEKRVLTGFEFLPKRQGVVTAALGIELQSAEPRVVLEGPEGPAALRWRVHFVTVD